MKNLVLWNQAVAFHGHACGGLAVGYHAALYAMELLELEPSEDEEVVCIAENDACGVDAIQAILGCTLGKGNLLLALRGKQAFNFYERKTGKSVRLVLQYPENLSKEEKLELLYQGDYHDFFMVKETEFPLPEPARIFKSETCSKCGERTAENYLHLEKGKLLCESCYVSYRRIL